MKARPSAHPMVLQRSTLSSCDQGVHSKRLMAMLPGNLKESRPLRGRPINAPRASTLQDRSRSSAGSSTMPQLASTSKEALDSGYGINSKQSDKTLHVLPTMSLSSPQLQPITGGHLHQSTAAAISGLDSSSHAALTDMQWPGLNNVSIAL